MIRTAILVDGGYYRMRAKYYWGEISAKERADELNTYCYYHINKFEHIDGLQSYWKSMTKKHERERAEATT